MTALVLYCRGYTTYPKDEGVRMKSVLTSAAPYLRSHTCYSGICCGQGQARRHLEEVVDPGRGERLVFACGAAVGHHCVRQLVRVGFRARLGVRPLLPLLLLQQLRTLVQQVVQELVRILSSRLARLMSISMSCFMSSIGRYSNTLCTFCRGCRATICIA